MISRCDVNGKCPGDIWTVISIGFNVRRSCGKLFANWRLKIGNMLIIP